LDGALELNPHLIEARRFRGEILLNEGMKEEALSSYRDLINHLDVPYLKFQCTNCGYQPLKLQWHCPQCRQWDTITRLDTGKSEKSPSEPSEMPSYAVSPRESEERV
jgi:lipopolysaccharide biosynthesis regulator YciM